MPGGAHERRRLSSPAAWCKVTQGVKKQSKAPENFGKKFPPVSESLLRAVPFPAVWDKVAELRSLLSDVIYPGRCRCCGDREEERMSPLGRVWRGRTRRRVRVPQAGYLPGGTPQRPGPAAGRQRGLGMARSRLRCFSLPFPPPLRVWFAFTGKFDASPRFFIGTGKKKRRKERRHQPRQGDFTLSPSLSFHRAPGFPVAAAARDGAKKRAKLFPTTTQHHRSLQSQSCVSIRWQHLPPVLSRFPQKQKGG